MCSIPQIWVSCVFIFNRIKKGEDRGKTCRSKTMMTKRVNESLKINTPHVSLSQNVEEKVRGKGLKTVWVDENG